MKSKSAIRIVKKPNDAPSDGLKEVAGDGLSRQTVREMAATVNSWVDEFQQRREDESLRLLRTLFPAQ